MSMGATLQELAADLAFRLSNMAHSSAVIYSMFEQVFLQVRCVDALKKNPVYFTEMPL